MLLSIMSKIIKTDFGKKPYNVCSFDSTPTGITVLGGARDANLRRLLTVISLTGVLGLTKFSIEEGRAMVSKSTHKLPFGTIWKHVPMRVICSFLFGGGTFLHLGVLLSMRQLKKEMYKSAKTKVKSEERTLK